MACNKSNMALMTASLMAISPPQSPPPLLAPAVTQALKQPPQRSKHQITIIRLHSPTKASLSLKILLVAVKSSILQTPILGTTQIKMVISFFIQLPKEIAPIYSRLGRLQEKFYWQLTSHLIMTQVICTHLRSQQAQPAEAQQQKSKSMFSTSTVHPLHQTTAAPLMRTQL